ncbi:MAG TPA: hypothetical protein VFG14_07115 [Chthoniobacteraceae bacterium]|jgi:preprotein translocase subunit SecD|nr:hypothetical protein [Chthoniobacteraceae bacterium]
MKSLVCTLFLILAASTFAQSPNRFEIARVNPGGETKTRTVAMEAGGANRDLKVEDPAPITQAHVSRAALATERIKVTSGEKPETKGVSVIRISFNGDGRKALNDLTETWKGRLIAVIVDGKCIASPKVVEPISRGELTLSGNFTTDEAKAIVAAIQDATKKK